MHDNPETHDQNSDVSPTAKSPYNSPAPNEEPEHNFQQDFEIGNIPFSVSNPANLRMQTISEQAGTGLFLDICAGSNRPLSSAIMQAGGTVCTFDILVHNKIIF